MPDELLVLFTAMTPIGELRASIPLGVLKFDLSWPVVLVISVIGNIAPVPLLLYLLKTVAGRIERWDNMIGAALRWRADRIERSWGARVRRYGFPAIVLIVAIPLPLTGAWTGSLAVWVLRVPYLRGFLAVAVGVLIAGAVVTSLTLAGVELIKLL